MDDNDAVLANNYNGISEAHEAIDKTALEINIWSKTEQDAGRRWHRARYLCPHGRCCCCCLHHCNPINIAAQAFISHTNQDDNIKSSRSKRRGNPMVTHRSSSRCGGGEEEGGDFLRGNSWKVSN